MRGNRPLIAAAALALLVGIAAGAAILLRGGAGTRQTIPPDAASAGSGPFLTAATMPQGLGGRRVPRFTLLDARGGSFSSARLSWAPLPAHVPVRPLRRCVPADRQRDPRRARQARRAGRQAERRRDLGRPAR